MRKIYRMILIIVSSVIVITSSGCANKQREKEDADYKVTGYCVINGKTMYFLADEEKERLREPLIKLLSNETHEVYADTFRGEIIGYEPYDPNEPTVPAGSACGLYDVTGDGMPELLIHPNGYYGSSGTVTYFAYDVFSGDYIGSIDGGMSESWCVYYFTETDELCSVGSYWRRGGWSERYRIMTFLKYEEDSNTCSEELYLYAHFSIDGESINTGEVGADGTYVGKWVESYPYARYSVRGVDVYLDDYYGEIDWFNINCVRIPETELQMISWWDVCSDDDRFVRAEQMVDALLSTSQEFIVPKD